VSGSADPGIGARWSGPDGAPVRLDLTLRPLVPGAEDFWSLLLAVQRSIPGCVRVVVLRGLSNLPPSPVDHDWSSRPSFVSVAVLDAPADGPALDLALAADLRVCTPDATLCRPGPASAGSLVASVGYATALDLAATGRAIDGAEAHRLGLVQRLAPAQRLDAEVEQLVEDLLTPDRDLVRELKALLLGASERGAAAQRQAQVEAGQRLHSLRAHGAAPT
jgi:hypothetical protein